MIRMLLGNCAWGTDEIPEGVQINLQDKDSGIIVTVPFQGDSLMQLVKEIAAKGLTEEQKRECAQHFNGGIVLPGTISLPDDFNPGPQG